MLMWAPWHFNLSVLKHYRIMYLMVHNSIFLILPNLLCAQHMSVFKLDTVSIKQYEYVLLETVSGTDCSCFISNPTHNDGVKLAVIGPSQNLKINGNHKLFNGVHTLKPLGQIIVTANFEGKDIRISNVTNFKTRIIISLLCPTDKK